MCTVKTLHTTNFLQNNISYNSDGENDIGNALHVHGDAQMDSKDRKLANYKVPSISHLGEGSYVFF